MAQIDVKCTGCNTLVSTIDSSKAADLPQMVFCKKCRKRVDQMNELVAMAEGKVNAMTYQFMTKLKGCAADFLALVARDPKVDPAEALEEAFNRNRDWTE